VPEPTLYLFDGYNLLHAGGFDDSRTLVDQLASFVALQGARGVVVFDGVGEEQDLGALAVRFAPDADALLERLAAEHRDNERVCLVSSDAEVRGTSGQDVRTVSSRSVVEWRSSASRSATSPETYPVFGIGSDRIESMNVAYSANASADERSRISSHSASSGVGRPDFGPNESCT
jgi:hypothetical protein